MTAVQIAHTARHPKHARAETLIGLAERMLREAGGDMNAAAEKMSNYVVQKPRLAAEAIRIACRALLGESVRSERAAMTPAPVGPTADNDHFLKAPFRMNDAARKAQERVAKLGKAHREAILDAPYTINGVSKSLRDHIGADVVSHGEVMLAQGSTTVRNARFLIAIGNTAGNRKVGDAVSITEALRLRKEADKTPV